MAYWEEVIHIKHLHHLYASGKISLTSLAVGMIGRLKSCSYYAEADPQFMEIVMQFSAIKKSSTFYNYKAALDNLYDFANFGNRIWIESLASTPSWDKKEDDNLVIAGELVNRFDEDYASKNQVNVDLKSKQQYTQRDYYKPSHKLLTPNSTIPITSSQVTSYTPPKYNRPRSVRFLTGYEFDNRLKSKGMSPKQLDKDFYEYVKDAPDDYQNWIIDRLKENEAGAVNMRAENAEANNQ